MRTEQHSIRKLELLHTKYCKLKKNSKRQSETQKINEAEFINDLDNLFDVAHMNALSLITIEEDKDFLIAQREKGRRGCMISVDSALAAKEQQ